MFDMTWLILPECTTAPRGFGWHPSISRRRKRFKSFEEYLGKRLPLKELFDPAHPEVYIIPRDGIYDVVDDWGDAIGFTRTILPFSSTDFYVDLWEGKGVFAELYHSPAWHRLGGISQLGYLVPPRPENWQGSNVRLAYTTPQFTHTRWIHSLIVAILMDLVLARNGFTEQERAPMVLTAACHDIAMPAGGDSIKRVDPAGLDEERNFSWVLRHHGLDKRWKERFGFNLAQAQGWVENKGTIGELLNMLDRIAYTGVDCYHVGRTRPGKIRSLCQRYPLVMDIWQDIRFVHGGSQFAFADPERLYRFILLRAYEHEELLFNPYSRALDLYLKKLVLPLYEKGEITREQLLTQDDEWLHQTLNARYPDAIKGYIEPEELTWEKFDTAEERKAFCERLGEKFDHVEHIRGFDTCLGWPVLFNGSIVPLRQALATRKVQYVERMMAKTRGYYVYYLRS